MTVVEAAPRPLEEPSPTPSETDLKATGIFSDYLKAELDRTTAKSRMLEDRARATITLAGSAAAVVALVRSQNLSKGAALPTDPSIWLQAAAFLTLVVIVAALVAHLNRQGGSAKVVWMREQREAIWAAQLAPAALHRMLQGDLITSIEGLRSINGAKSIAVLVSQIAVVLQLICIALYLAGK